MNPINIKDKLDADRHARDQAFDRQSRLYLTPMERSFIYATSNTIERMKRTALFRREGSPEEREQMRNKFNHYIQEREEKKIKKEQEKDKSDKERREIAEAKNDPIWQLLEREMQNKLDKRIAEIENNFLQAKKKDDEDDAYMLAIEAHRRIDQVAGSGIASVRLEGPYRSPRIRVDYKPWTLRCVLTGNQVAVSAGTICLPNANAAVSATTVSLTGSTEYVYVQYDRFSGSTQITHSTTRPSSNSTYICVVLTQYTAVTPAQYTLTTVMHEGDIILESPTR